MVLVVVVTKSCIALSLAVSTKCAAHVFVFAVTRRVMLHSGGDAVEVFLVQHVANSADAAAQQQQQGAAEQQQTTDTAMVDQQPQQLQQQQQQPYVQEAPGLGMPSQQQHHQHLQAQQVAAAAGTAGAGAAAAHPSQDITMEPPGNLPMPAAGSSQRASEPAAAPATSAPAAAATAAAAVSASPISLLAEAIGAGGVSANDIPVLPPAGAAAMVKQEGSGAAGAAVQPVVGLNSPVFPPPGSLSSPALVGCASPAQAGKWNEIDPEAWFEGDGAALGALGDFFKNDSSIFNQSAAAAAATDQQDNDLVSAW